MDVACKEKTWGNYEAIYSFQLPEGSVATSLSLWVSGIERKGVLTTKEKAKAVYNTIVGVQSRDPSLMQWREGNRVVVRIFPVTYEMPRTFKCGFTTPLKASNSTLDYKSLNINGPSIVNAETLSRIQVVGNSKFDSSKDFTLKNGFYCNESDGFDDWNVSLPINNSFTNSFYWKNKNYQIKKIEKEIIPFTPSEIVLDLNSNWELESVETLLNKTSKKYFVFINDQKEEINKINYKMIFEQFESLQYSLLPLYKLQNGSLIVTNSGTISANFEELENSKYLTKIKTQTKDKSSKVISIADEINPFWQTIKEQKYVEFIKTDLDKCVDLINKNQFYSIKTADNLVNIEPANIAIEEINNPINPVGLGSNHLYRMYAFGKVLSEHISTQNDTLANNKYVDLAKEANIVTPVSSLLVLETDKDYKDNGIEKNVNTLGNASINNDGSVPEPQEWVLIILGAISLFIYFRKQNKVTI